MADQTERLKLIVDAATSDAESGFRRLTAEAQGTAGASDTAARSVAEAADRVAQARLKEQDAAGKLSVAELKLEEVRGRYSAGSSQVAAAEERVATAQRQLQVATTGTVRATEEQEVVQRRAGAAAQEHAADQENLGRSVGRTGDALKSAAVAAGALAAAGLAAGIREAVTAYTDGARAAGLFGNATNATTEEASRLLGLVGSLGLDINDLIEIQAEFAQKSGDLDEVGVTLQRNADGTVNWTRTLEQTLVALQGIPDATARNAAGFKFFGEEGYKQLQRLVNGGVDVADALEQIGTPFDDADVRNAAEFDAVMTQVKLSGGELARTVGSDLLPVIVGLFGAFQTAAGVIEAIPAPIAAAVAAAVALGIASKVAATEGSFLAGALAGAQGAASRFTATAAASGAGTAVLTTGLAGARAAGVGLLGVLGGPVGVAFLAAGVGVSLLTGLLGDNAGQAERTAQASQDLTEAIERQNGVITDSVRQQAAKSLADAGVLDALEAIGVNSRDATEGLLGNAEAYDRVQAAIDAYYDSSLLAENAGDLNMTENAEAARDAGGAYADLAGDVGTATENSSQLAAATGEAMDAQALATAATEALTAAIDAGNTSGEEYQRLVREAAAAQGEASAATDASKAALEALNAVTREAVQTQLDAISAELGRQDAQYAFLTAVDAVNAAQDDSKTTVDEVAQAYTRLQTAALTAAGSAADAAVETARAAGQPLTDLAEAQVRADAVIASLQANLANLAPEDGQGRAQIQGIIDQLTVARDNGTIEATLETVGVGEATSELDTATEDRETLVNIETRGGPAAMSYLDDDVAQDRLALIKIETRGGPAAKAYLDSLDDDRWAIINVETRGGPAVEAYLDELSRTRTATINVRQQAVGAPVQAGQGPTGVPSRSSMLAGVGPGGTAVANNSTSAATTNYDVGGNHYTVNVEGRGPKRTLAEEGRQIIHAIQAAEKTGSARWRRTT